MRESEHFNLFLAEGSDLVNPLVQDVQNYQDIDEQMFKNQNAGVQNATELKNGTVHAITRNVPDAQFITFTATSNYTAGETFTVDGIQVTALTVSGETLPTGAYVINSQVLCALKGTLLTVYGVGSVVADNSLALNGHPDTYFGTKEDVDNANDTANAAYELVNAVNTNLTDIRTDLEIVNNSLDNKQATITGAASTIASSNLTENRALVSNSSGKVDVSAVTTSELGCLDGVTSNVQAQINSVKSSYLPIAGGILAGDVRPNTAGKRSLGADPYNFAGVYSNHYLIANSSGTRVTDIYNAGNTLIFGVTEAASVRSRTSLNTFLPITASSFNTSSSKRYKENINDITEERAKKILDVNVVTYDYKGDITTNPLDKTGVIAEDVVSVIPEVVTYTTIDDKEVPDSVDYSKFVPYLIKMIQIQQDEIDKLKNS